MGRGCRLLIAVAPGHMRYRHGTALPGTGAGRRGPSLSLHVGPCDNTIRVPATRILCAITSRLSASTRHLVGRPPGRAAPQSVSVVPWRIGPGPGLFKFGPGLAPARAGRTALAAGGGLTGLC